MCQILIIEDDEEMQMAFTLMLEQAGYCIFAVPTAETALDILRLESFDLVLVDLLLPGMDGAELCRIIRSDGKTARVPILMVSCMPSHMGLEFTEKDTAWAPANRFIDKRDSAHRLLPVIQDLLSAHPADPDTTANPPFTPLAKESLK